MAADHRTAALVIASSADAARSLVEAMPDEYQVEHHADTRSAIRALAHSAKWQVVLIVLDGTDEASPASIADLNRHLATSDVPILVLLEANDPVTHEALLQAGAADCLMLPLSAPLLAVRLANLRRARAARTGQGVSGGLSEDFRALVQNATQGIVVHRDMNILFANQAFAEMHGFASPQEVLDLGRLDALIATEDQHRLMSYAQSRGSANPAPLRYDYEATRLDGTAMTLQCTVSVTRWEGEPAIQAAVLDVTEQMHAAAALRESEARFAAFFNNSPHTMSIQAPDGSILLDNPAVRRFSDFTANEALGRLPDELWNPELAHNLKETNRRVLETMDVADCESPITVGAETRYIWVTKFPIVDEDGQLMALGSIGSEVTARKEAELRVERYQQELRELAAEISLAEERERRRISTEIHDGAVQNLGLARIKIGTLIKRSEETGRLIELRDLLVRSIRELRALMSELSPPMLYERGLGPALEWLATHFAQNHGLETDVRAPNQLAELSNDLAVLLFQAVRELLMNVVKHAHARHARIELEEARDHLVVTVSDDGVGMADNTLARGPARDSGFGLFNLSERLRLVDGRMDVEVDSGTRVRLWVPLVRPGS